MFEILDYTVINTDIDGDGFDAKVSFIYTDGCGKEHNADLVVSAPWKSKKMTESNVVVKKIGISKDIYFLNDDIEKELGYESLSLLKRTLIAYFKKYIRE